MKTRIVVGPVSLFAAGVAFAQQSEPVVGVKDPEALFKDSNPTLNKNKQAALHIERELLQCGQWERAGEWLTDAYHQHNPNADTGLKAVVYFFTQVLKQPRQATCGPLTAKVVAVMADGPYVTVLTATAETDNPNSPGKKYNTSWFDTWRFVDGKADEHWDPATIAARAPAAPAK
jgi:predicted SnoaL-like aldol condensation-catalyzing enzyme